MNGATLLPLPDRNPLLWIDNSLNPNVARALATVGYRTVVQSDLPEFKDLVSVKDDDHIIPWCERNDAVWVHADDNARTQHAKQIVAADLRTIWIYLTPRFQWTAREQLRLLSFALPEILDEFGRSDPEWRHFEIRPQGRAIRVRGFVLSD